MEILSNNVGLLLYTYIWNIKVGTFPFPYTCMSINIKTISENQKVTLSRENDVSKKLPGIKELSVLLLFSSQPILYFLGYSIYWACCAILSPFRIKGTSLMFVPFNMSEAGEMTLRFPASFKYLFLMCTHCISVS